MRRSAALEAAGHAAGAWLELAAADERLAVRQAQVERLERALVLQRKRFELGEVSGAEVKQLELERLRLVNEKNAHRVRRLSASEDLARLAGPGAPGPRPGDLRRLSEGFRPVRIPEHEVDARIDSSPVMTASSLDTERIRLVGERDRRTVRGRPEAELEWERIPAFEDLDGFDAWGFRLSFPLPIGGLAKRQAAESAARHREARSREELARRELVARLRSEIELAHAADEVLAGFGDIETELAEVEHSVSERYRLGAQTYLEYIDGLSRLDDVRMQAIDARLAAARARLVLAVLTGDVELFPLPEPDPVTDIEAEGMEAD
jgi:outer membrane protein TolC